MRGKLEIAAAEAHAFGSSSSGGGSVGGSGGGSGGGNGGGERRRLMRAQCRASVDALPPRVVDPQAAQNQRRHQRREPQPSHRIYEYINDWGRRTLVVA